MLSPRLGTCLQCTDINSLLKEIDCTIAKMGQKLYVNTVYMLNTPVNEEAISSLLHYKRILEYKFCNADYAGHYSVEQIVGKVKKYTIGCINPCEQLSIINNDAECCTYECTITGSAFFI